MTKEESNKTSNERIAAILKLVLAELNRAMNKHPPMPTLHHGYAVIKEELDELWEEIKQQEIDVEAIQYEAVQVAAMAVRLVFDMDGMRVRSDRKFGQ